MIIRPVTEADYPRLLEIYNPYIKNTTITLETKELTTEEFSARIDGIREHFPYLVAEEDGIVIAYAYLSSFHERAGYRFTVDLSVYCDNSMRHRGAGTALVNELISIAEESGFANVVSLITDENEASVEFHKKLGFETFAHFRHSAYKHGRWLGVYYMVKVLDGSDNEPSFRGNFGIEPLK